MLKLIAKRLLWMLPIMLVVSFSTYALVDLSPTNVAAVLAGDQATPANIARVRAELHLDDPLPVRYGRWLAHAVHGDLGKSYFTNQPVKDAITQKLPINLSIAAVALAMTVLGALFLGVLGALWPGGAVDRTVTGLSSLFIAIPGFWLAMLLVLQLAVYRRLLPALGYVGISSSPWQWLRHLLIPGFAISATASTALAVQLKGSLIDALGRDYVLTARAKGLATRTIVFKHALRNAAIPVITLLGLRAGALLVGSVVVEQIFSISGLGSMLINSANVADINPLMGIVLVVTLVVTLTNAAVDIAYGYLNPKLRV
ncbi:MAG: ABC transporter permease [Acidobacteria bacterium]|nr:ABC transporter permease [Acidobacteriota bacterium]